jgi:hypothetical protein
VIQLRPSATRYVAIVHDEWNATWNFQIPESIACTEGWILDYQPLAVDWQTNRTPSGETALEFSWTSTDDYIRYQADLAAADTTGTLGGKSFISGVQLDVHLTTEPDAITIRLRLTNRSGRRLTRVTCDGGCFQARSSQFAGPAETERTHMLCGGSFAPLAGLHRTVADRALYLADPADYDRPPLDEGEWFWGRSTAIPDSPVTLAMQATGSDRFAVFAYDRAAGGSANSDDHHCIHSRPDFGVLDPGESRERVGAIAFASSLQTGLARVRALTSNREERV